MVMEATLNSRAVPKPDFALRLLECAVLVHVVTPPSGEPLPILPRSGVGNALPVFLFHPYGPQPSHRRSDGSTRNQRWTIRLSPVEWPFRLRSPAWPFSTRERVWRATPKTSAAWVTFSPRGSRQFSLMLRPGWGGFFIGMVTPSSSVVIDEVDVVHVATFKPEGDPPVSGDRNAP